MAKYIRANAWNKGGTFENEDLLWYAIGVGEMQKRALDDPHSWWFFAAIHGEYVTPASIAAADPGTLLWKDIPAPPAVPVTPLPKNSVSDKYWNQCQHQSWYFPPWHRGYLLALEAHIRGAIAPLKGAPETWALPYWNYLGPKDEFKIPPAFTQTHLPNGNPNPLYVNARYGPDQNRTIYIPTRAVIKQHPTDPNFIRGPVTDDYMANDLYTGSDASTKPPGFGGPKTPFWHDGGTSGNLESDPHNNVHVYVGKNLPNGSEGLMSDPGLAALDPIFYLHHANIDRMWAVWNDTLSRTNPTDPDWLNGPTAVGDRTFIMPMPSGTPLAFVPQQMNSLGKLDYTYDILPAAPTVAVPVTSPLVARFEALGAPDIAAKVKKGVHVTMGTKTELVGATESPLTLNPGGAATTVRLDSGVRRKVSASFAMAKEAAAAEQLTAPDRVYLNLENVRGSSNSAVLSVYIDLPGQAKPADHPELFAGSVGLFGLRRASEKEGVHGGGGLSFVLDITPVVDHLHLNRAFDSDSLGVKIVPDQPIPDRSPITIGKISIYREGQ
jgi:tyrosinase